MRMILLHADEAAPVYINPLLVRAVMSDKKSATHVYFDDVHSVEVQESAEAVAREIENVR